VGPVDRVDNPRRAISRDAFADVGLLTDDRIVRERLTNHLDHGPLCGPVRLGHHVVFAFRLDRDVRPKGVGSNTSTGLSRPFSEHSALGGVTHICRWPRRRV